MLGKTPLWIDLLISFSKGAEIASLICFITFVGMLLGPVLFLMLKSETMRDIPSSVVSVMRNVFFVRIYEVVRIIFFSG